MSRGVLLAWLLIPQFIFVLLAGAIVWVMIKVGSHLQPVTSNWARKMLSLMGNMTALPQVILSFAMLDIFSYNSWQRHIMPMWLFLLIIVGLATIALIVLLALAFSRARRQF